MRVYKLFDINFLNGDYDTVSEKLKNGGLMVVPAAPALATIKEDQLYYNALLNSDFAIPDSGLMVLVLKIFKFIRIKKLSGLAFLDKFLNENILKENHCLFLVDPNEKEATINQKYLKSLRILIKDDDHYIAPFYNKDNIVDYVLLKLIEEKKPKYILINLGGGVQERLGSFLKNNLSYQPGILCTGAAIAFFTGQQVFIPRWVDKLFLGWLWRCFSNPHVFIPRYLKGFKFILMLLNEPVKIKGIK
jgi:N-acetylglucosaminyldiphosphoundecaprenol N-acetyl-beta-D-mannosaminyltransferase